MNGLEEIVLTIKQKADSQCEDIAKKAAAKADEIKKDAEKTAEAECGKIIAEANRKSELIIESSKSAAVSNRLKEILKFKSQTVSEVIEKMLSDIEALSTEEYFLIIKKLVLSNFHKNESGKIMFGEKDTKRIPAGFIEDMNKSLSEYGASLTQGDTVNIKNGFVLSYGDIEENCSFDAIVSSKEESLKDEIASILFS